MEQLQLTTVAVISCEDGGNKRVISRTNDSSGVLEMCLKATGYWPSRTGVKPPLTDSHRKLETWT